MACRPLAFGARFRDKGRTLRVRAVDARRGRYVVEDQASDRPTRRRVHGSLTDAMRDFAATWRGRLN